VAVGQPSGRARARPADDRDQKVADDPDRNVAFGEAGEDRAAMKRNTSFLPLDLDTSRTDGMREQSLGQLHGYAAAARTAYDPHLFDNPNTPLSFRPDKQLPQPDWRNLRETFSFEWIGRYYDYIIVNPLARDPLATYRGRDVEWVRDAGPWRLYRVTDKR
jgi:hypothetical protein